MLFKTFTPELDKPFNAQRRRSQRGAAFVLMFERQRVTQKVRSVGCRSAADC
ncbi:hypothetical protein ACJJI4_01230 [Microbulbifer sp. TRSA002]|uniref:hypothetical protein n=1 Tax=Microbulbifer sp. TRSA002 TaxID=3243382 RepID=UPI004039411F